MIALENVNAGYQGKQILHEVSFEVKAGENLSIIGPNGCGKTTLLRAVAGILPFTGQITIGKTDIRSLKRRQLAKRIALLPQITRLSFPYTAAELVMMGRYVHQSGGLPGSASDEDRVIVEDVLYKVGMLNKKDRDADTLSGGELQRVLLAKIFAQNPDAILLDEPTNHLDLSYQVELIRFLGEWSKQENKTVVGVLHDINLAMLLSKDVLLMDQGRVVIKGKAQEVYASPLLSQTYRMDVRSHMLYVLEQWNRMEPASAPGKGQDLSDGSVIS